MNSRFRLNTSNVDFFVQSLLALFLATLGVASAAGTGTTTEVCRIPLSDGKCIPIPIKDSNYPIPSGAYFVSPDGKNTNSGNNATSPWPVAKALDSAPSGATIVFRGGTYRNINAKIRKKLTLQPYPHEQAWLKGSVEVTGWVADGTTWRKDGWTYSFPSNVSSEYINPSYPLAGHRDMVYINGVFLKQVASKAEVVPGTFYVDSTNDKLYIGNNPTGKTVEATALERAFGMGTSDTANPSDTVIRGLGFAHYADMAIGIGAPRVTLENNTFVWNGEQGVSLWGESNGTLGISTDAIVRGNTFSYNGRNGLWGDRAHRMLLEYNKLSYNNVERFSTSHDGAGVKVLRTDGLTWRNNFVEHNFATGMWADISSSNAKIVHNTSRYNHSAGIYFEVSHKAIIAANVVYGNSTGIHVSNSSSVRVYNNTLDANGTDLRIKDTTRDNTNAKEIAAGNTWIARNNDVKNNIFSNVTKNDTALFDASNCGTNEASALMISAADYNAYYRTVSSTPPIAIKWSLGSGKCRIGYPSVAAFNSATGYEAHALVIDNVAPNPFFVDPANGNYHLKPGSPAIGRGDVLPPDIAQAIGLPSGVKVDLGALQATVH